MFRNAKHQKVLYDSGTTQMTDKTQRPDIEDFMGLEQSATRGPWFVTTKLEIGPKSDSDDQNFGFVTPIADVFGENKAVDALFISTLRTFAVDAAQYALALEKERDAACDARNALINEKTLVDLALVRMEAERDALKKERDDLKVHLAEIDAIIARNT